MMDIEIRTLRKRDFNDARKFAIDGMHLHWFTNNKLELYFYSKYFWYSELSRATRALGAYMGDTLVGVLLVDMNNEPKAFKSIRYTLFNKLANHIIKLGFINAQNAYDAANRELLADYKRHHAPDGELNFFAVDPQITGKGLGTRMLSELERLERGKLIFLYTDSGCTHQFYSRRGFDQVGEQEIQLKVGKREFPFTCMLFSKQL